MSLERKDWRPRRADRIDRRKVSTGQTGFTKLGILKDWRSGRTDGIPSLKGGRSDGVDSIEECKGQ